MSDIHESGPAFPITDHNQIYELGISKRDWFAGQAIIGLIGNGEAVHAGAEPTNSCLFGSRGKETAYAYAKSAYLLADAMLSARSNRGEEDNA